MLTNMFHNVKQYVYSMGVFFCVCVHVYVSAYVCVRYMCVPVCISCIHDLMCFPAYPL